MTRIQFNRGFLYFLAIASPLALIAYSAGFVVPTRSTGGSFPEERSCTACHSGTANSGGGAVTVTIDGGDPAAYRYTPGEQVRIAVRIAETAKKSFGFQFSARDEEGCVQAGVFNTADDTVYIGRDSATPEGCSGSTVEFPTHANPMVVDDAATFEFLWTAPPEDIGDVRFAAAGLAGNGDGDDDGDSTYTWEGRSQSAGGGAVAPKINAGGVVLATGTPVVTQLSPSAIATVFGEQFAPDGTQILAPELDENERVSDKIANTCVEVNGEWTPLFAVLPNQINFQIPHDAGLGTAQVRVVRGCNTESEVRTDPETVTIVSAAPAFFNFTNAADGKNPIAALRPDYTLVAPEGMYPQSPGSGPAAPGEYVLLFATGLGLTQPAIVTGGIPLTEVPNGQAEVVNRSGVRILVGGVEVPAQDIAYVGAAPCCAGLYQVAFRVPDTVANGDQPVEIWVNGVQSPAGPFIAIKRP